MRILFLDFSTGIKVVDELYNRPRGGIVNSLHRIPDALNNMRNECTVLSDILAPGITREGTEWHNKESFADDGLHRLEYDFLVLNRGIGAAYQNINAKKRILWTHDMPHAGFIPNPEDMRHIDATVFMSKYGENVWRCFYKTIGKSFFIPNGVDELFKDPGCQRNYHKLIYASHPNRGLKRLPFIHDCVSTRVGEIETVAYSSGQIYSDGKFSVDDESVAVDYEKTEKPGFSKKEPIRPDELASELQSSGLMVLPSGFPEICSNSVLQALASGLPVITTGRVGATCEWVHHRYNGMLTEYQPNDYMVYQVELIRNIVEVLNNRKLHKKLINNARKTKVHTWQEIAKRWQGMFKKIG